MRLAVCTIGRTDTTLAQAHRTTSIPVPSLFTFFLTVWPPCPPCQAPCTMKTLVPRLARWRGGSCTGACLFGRNRSLVDQHDQDRRLMWCSWSRNCVEDQDQRWIPKIMWKIRNNDWNEITLLDNEWKFTIVIIVLFDHTWSMTNDEDNFRCLHVNSDLRASSAVQ